MYGDQNNINTESLQSEWEQALRSRIQVEIREVVARFMMEKASLQKEILSLIEQKRVLEGQLRDQQIEIKRLYSVDQQKIEVMSKNQVLRIKLREYENFKTNNSNFSENDRRDKIISELESTLIQ